MFYLVSNDRKLEIKRLRESGLRNWRWSNTKIEVDKTILLCNRCHSELHAGLWDLDQTMIEEQTVRRSAYEDKSLDFYTKLMP